jgi:hypothetical protein
MPNAKQGFGRNLWIAAIAMILIAPQGRSLAQDKGGAATTGATAAKADVQVMKGIADGHIYKNSFLGVEISLPDDLQFHEAEVITDSGSAKRMIKVSAGSKPHNKFAPKKYIVDTGVIFFADFLSGFPEEQRTEDAYMRAISQAEVSSGFKRIDGKSVEKIGETTFMRGNFAQGNRQHILLVTLRKDYAFSFIFFANDMASADTLIASATVKLPQ